MVCKVDNKAYDKFAEQICEADEAEIQAEAMDDEVNSEAGLNAKKYMTKERDNKANMLDDNMHYVTGEESRLIEEEREKLADTQEEAEVKIEIYQGDENFPVYESSEKVKKEDDLELQSKALDGEGKKKPSLSEDEFLVKEKENNEILDDSYCYIDGNCIKK